MGTAHGKAPKALQRLPAALGACSSRWPAHPHAPFPACQDIIRLAHYRADIACGIDAQLAQVSCLGL